METEAKFIVPDDETLGRLRDIDTIGEYTRRETHGKHVEDRYVDTPDRAFYRERYFVRLREAKSGEDSPVLTIAIKNLGAPVKGAIHSREEYQAVVPGLDISSWPEGEARQLAERVAGGAPLTDLVSLKQERTVSTLYKDTTAIAEMSLDEMTVEGGSASVRELEMEVELLPEGRKQDLRAISKLVQAEYGLKPQPLSKFERALKLAGQEPGAVEVAPAPEGDRPTTGQTEPATPPPEGAVEQDRLLPTDDMAVAARKLLKDYFGLMLKHDAGTRSGEDAEAVHDMRVSTRRMRSVLRVMGDYLSGSEVDRARRGLRVLTRALGRLRDLDVLIGHAEAFRASLPPEQATDLDGLLAEWNGRRDRALKKVKKLLSSKEYERLKDNLGTLLDRARAPRDRTAEVEPRQVRHAAGSAVWSKYEPVRAYETVMDAPTLLQMHALRIHAKYLRYTLESFRDALAPDARKLIADVIGIQDHLGHLHDADVAAGLIRAHIQAEAGRGKKSERSERVEASPGLAAYLQEREGTVRRLYAEFPPVWEKIIAPEWRTRLALVVSSL